MVGDSTEAGSDYCGRASAPQPRSTPAHFGIQLLSDVRDGLGASRRARFCGELVDPREAWYAHPCRMLTVTSFISTVQ